MSRYKIMTKIKICGIKTLPAALAAVRAGADYLGFNFYPKSPRFVEKQTCAEINAVLKKEYPHIKLVGVFVNSSVEVMKDILSTCSLDLAQLHGDETAEMLNALNGKAFKAFRGISTDFETDKRIRTDGVPAFLIDASVKGIYGGSGVVADWDGAAELAKKYPLLLAGGLTPENVAEAVRRVKPWGVDVASGVESTVGEKDAAKMVEFIKKVREVED